MGQAKRRKAEIEQLKKLKKDVGVGALKTFPTDIEGEVVHCHLDIPEAEVLAILEHMSQPMQCATMNEAVWETTNRAKPEDPWRFFVVHKHAAPEGVFRHPVDIHLCRDRHHQVNLYDALRRSIADRAPLGMVNSFGF